MTTQYKLAKAYSAKLGESLTRVNLEEFFHTVRNEFYVDINVDFMEYFIELTEYEDFVIHRTKLIEYGIMTSSRSSNIKDKFENIGLVDGVDFILKEVHNQRLTRGASNTKDYYLNADSFKKCLMRAKRHIGQEVDPMVYCDYYILLERMYILYTYYQRTYDAKLLSIKDEKIEKQSEKIDELSKKSDKQSEKIDELVSSNKELRARMDKLLGYAEDTKEKLATTNSQLATTNSQLATTNTTLEIVSEELTTTNSQLTKANQKIDTIKMTVQNIANVMTNGFNMFTSFVKNNIFSSANKTQASETKKYLELLNCNGKISKMKIQYLVATRYDDGEYEVYSKCTNVDGIYTALNNLYSRRELIGPFAIGLNLNEINSEKKNIKDLIPGVTNRKTFYYKSDLNKLVAKMREAHMSNYGESNEIIKYIIEQDSEFNSDLLASLQSLLDKFVVCGYPFKPSRSIIDSMLSNIMRYIDRDFNDDKKILRLIEDNGEAKLRAQIEDLSKMS
jgi:hypothetical protein